MAWLTTSSWSTQTPQGVGGLVATDDVDFTIPRGSIVALIGPNGVGQDDVLQPADGRLQADVGFIVSTDRGLPGLPPHAITALGVGRTFQNIRLFAQMTAIENVLVGMHCRLHSGILGAYLRDVDA